MRTARRIKRLSALLGLVLAAAPAGAAPPAPGQPGPAGQPVAIYELRALGLAADRGQAWQQAIAQAFGRSPAWRLLPRSEVRRRLAAAGLDARATPARAAPAIGARYLISGTLAGLGQQLSLDFKLLDGRDGRELRRVALEVAEEPKARAEALDELVVRLLEPERWVGGLELEVSEPGAQVWLDGKLLATTPLPAPLERLAPGKHILLIRKDGFGEFSKFVVVRYGQQAHLKVDLASATVVGLLYERRAAVPAPAAGPAPQVARRAPAAPGLSWQQIAGFSCLGLAAAAAASGGLLGWHSQDLEGQVERGWWTQRNADELLAKQADGRRFARWANRMFISAGALAAASAGLLLWGYLGAADGPEPTASLAPLPGGLAVGLSGRF